MTAAIVAGTPYELEADEAGYCWVTMPPPLCPECGESLGAGCDDEDRRTRNASKWHDDQRVGCDGCGKEFEVTA